MLHKYLQRRGDIYYFRWRVPADLRPILGVTELKHSLRTANQLQASVRAGRYVVAVSGMQSARDAYSMLELTFGEYVSEIEKQWMDLCYMTRKKKTKMVKTGYITVGDMSFDYGGDVEKELSAVAQAKEMGLLPQTAGQIQPNQVVTAGPLLSEVFNGFLAHKTDVKERQKENKKPLSERIQKEHKRNFKKLIAAMGENPPISTITRKALKEAILICANLPLMTKSPYNRMKIQEVLEMEIPEKDRVKGKTAIEVKKTAQGIFAYAVDVAELIDTSPAKGMKLGVKLDSVCTFAPYTDAEVKMILAALSEESEPWRQWLPMLAAYTGARRSELVQLRTQDIKFDTDSGRHYILITGEAGSVKNENATRQVPLHVALIDKGFLDFKDKTDGRLFNDLDPQAVTKWFTRFLDRLGVERFDDYGNRKVFHSFRHSFITKSQDHNPVHHVQQVVGHEQTNTGTTAGYTHPRQLKFILGVVDMVSYD